MDDLSRLTSGDVEEALEGLPEDRKHAADVAAGALRAAAADWLSRRR